MLAGEILGGRFELVESSGEEAEELAGVVCRCVAQLADSLEPEYADALRRIEIEGISVKEYADAARLPRLHV